MFSRFATVSVSPPPSLVFGIQDDCHHAMPNLLVYLPVAPSGRLCIHHTRRLELG